MSPPRYDFHFFVCQNLRPENHSRGSCMAKGSDKLLNYMKVRVKELGIANVRINKAGCLDQCEKGPAIIVYPEGIWYRASTIEDMETIIQSHILQKVPAEHLRLK